ncbi:MAG: hypothetical protein AB8B56_08875 [Crocinitomicaceae bacterium]
MKTILRISTILVISLSAVNCAHIGKQKLERVACKAQTILQLESDSDDWKSSISHLASFIENDVDSSFQQSIERTGLSISNNTIDLKVSSYNEPAKLIQLNLLTTENCACEILLDTLTLLLNENYLSLEKERTRDLHNSKLAQINSRLKEIKEEIKMIENQSDRSSDFSNLEQEYTQLIEQKAIIEIARAGESTNSFRVLRSAVRYE